MAPNGPTLNDLRDEIDQLDDQILDALLRRARIAADIAPLKASAGAPLLRPGREAEVLRRLVAKADNGFDPLTLIRIWREIMSAALRLQGPFSVAVAVPEVGPTCWGLARSQYGVATEMNAAAGAAQAVAAVIEGRAQVAVVPFPQAEEASPWWARLLGNDAPRVVARLPVAVGLAPPAGCTDGLVIAAMSPEASSEDRSLVAIETTEALSRAAVARGLEKAGLALTFCATGGAGSVVSLAEVEGFHAGDASLIEKLTEAFGDSARHIAVIGAYAMPLSFKKPGA